VNYDHLHEIAAAAAHLSGALQRAGIYPAQWAVQLRDHDARDALMAAARPGSPLPAFGPLPPGVATRIGGIDILEPERDRTGV
jgi:hypothetical protein